MTDKLAIYDTDAAKDLSIEQLTAIFKDKNVTNIYFKQLSSNDNSKNQPYMAGHLTDLSFIPTGDIIESVSDSQKDRGKRKIKYLVSPEKHLIHLIVKEIIAFLRAKSDQKCYTIALVSGRKVDNVAP